MKSGKNKKTKQRTEALELPNQERIRTFGENENYNYLGILKVDTNKQSGMREKN